MSLLLSSEGRTGRGRPVSQPSLAKAGLFYSVSGFSVGPSLTDGEGWQRPRRPAHLGSLAHLLQDSTLWPPLVPMP